MDLKRLGGGVGGGLIAYDQKSLLLMYCICRFGPILIESQYFYFTFRPLCYDCIEDLYYRSSMQS